MWILLAAAAALFQVLRNTTMKRLGHALDEYINVWGRFTFLLPFALAACLVKGWPTLKPGFFAWCALFGVSQTISTLALSKALKLSPISLVTPLWKRYTPAALSRTPAMPSVDGTSPIHTQPSPRRTRRLTF